MNTDTNEIQDTAVDYWKVFATDRGQDFLKRITTIVEEREKPQQKYQRKKEAYANYLKLTHALVANLAHLYLLQQATSEVKGGLYVSRSKRVLGRKSQKHTSMPPFVGEQLLRLLDTLTATDLIRQVVPAVVTRGRVCNPFAKSRRYGDSTVIYPTGRFIRFMLECGVESLEDVRRDAAGEEVVLLKSLRADDEALLCSSSEIDYEDNAIADGYRETLRQLQAWIDATHVFIINRSEPSKTTGMLIDPRMRRLRRIFTRERWDSCGRYYGAWWMPLSKAERFSRIVLDGHRVAELDFSSMMVRLAYGLVKVQPPKGDQYAIPGFERSRDCMKVLFSALLFDKPGYNRKRLPEDALKGLHPEEARPARVIIKALKEYHKPLLGVFGTGVGHELFFQESQIMTGILQKLGATGIPGLPVHDALYVPYHRVEEGRKIMEQVFSDQVGMEGVVKVTLPTLNARELEHELGLAMSLG